MINFRPAGQLLLRLVRSSSIFNLCFRDLHSGTNAVAIRDKSTELIALLVSGNTRPISTGCGTSLDACIIVRIPKKFEIRQDKIAVARRYSMDALPSISRHPSPLPPPPSPLSPICYSLMLCEIKWGRGDAGDKPHGSSGAEWRGEKR